MSYICPIFLEKMSYNPIFLSCPIFELSYNLTPCSVHKSQNCSRCDIMLVSILISYSKDLEEALPLIEKYQEKLVAIGEVSV